MRRRNIYIIQFLLATLLVLSSCRQDEVLDNVESTPVNGITLKLSAPVMAGTKAINEDGDDNLNENRIKTLDVFIYQENGDACLFYQHIVPPTELTGTGEYKKVLDVTQEVFAVNVRHSIYVIANYTGVIPAGGYSLSDLKALPVLSLIDGDKKQDNFIMDGVYTMVLNDYIIVNKEIPVSLKRAAAKIRVTVSYGSEFSLLENASISKKLFNYASNSALIATGNEVDPGLQTMAAFTDQNSGAGNTNNIITYSYANDWNDISKNETYLLVNIPVKDSQGVEYPLNYYKIPVNYRLSEDDDNTNLTPEQEEARKALYKLERNRLYDVVVAVDKLGTDNPNTAIELNGNYTIADWTSKEILVAVEGVNVLYVKDTEIRLPNSTSFTTAFQSSSQNVSIGNITVNGVAINNGSNGVNITWTQNAKYGNINITSTLPINFIEKEIKFTVSNDAGLSQDVTVSQYPALYLSSDVSDDIPSGGQGQNNTAMYIMTSLVADFSTLKNPDEFDEDFGSGYSHFAPNPALGASYAEFIRTNAVLGYPKTDSDGATLDTDENNRRISPRFMLASQYGTTTAASYLVSRNKCIAYVERDSTTQETYSDWRMPTLAEIYMIDILQNTKVSEVKKILEGSYYWSARASSTVQFMDPRVGNTAVFGPLNASVRCVRDVKN